MDSDSINCVFVGGLVSEPGELREANTGEKVVNFILLSIETRKEHGTGRPRKVKEWHRITAYGDLAIRAARLVKGDNVLVQGRFQHNRRTVGSVFQHSVDIIADRLQVSGRAAAPDTGDRRANHD